MPPPDYFLPYGAAVQRNRQRRQVAVDPYAQYTQQPDVVDDYLSPYAGYGQQDQPAPQHDVANEYMPHAQSATHKEAAPQLTPEDQHSILSDLGQKGMSALSYTASTLDKPGAAVRGLLAGRPDQLLNLIPFSDTLGITNPDERTQPEDLTGLKSEEGDDWLTKAGKFGANLGVGIATDPLTYLTFGASAISKAGKAAKAADLLENATTLASRSEAIPEAIGKRTTRLFATPQKIIDAMPAAKQGAAMERWKAATAAMQPSESAAMLNERLGGLFGVGLPFQSPVATYAGPGAATAAKYLDKAGNAVRWSAPGRNIAALMDSKVMGAKTRIGQEDAAMLYNELPRAHAAAMQDVNDVGRMIDQLGLTDQQAGKKSLTALLEAPDNPTVDMVASGISGGDPAKKALALELRAKHDAAHAASLSRQNQIGVGGSAYSDPYANYMTRHMAGSRGTGGSPKVLGTQTPEELGRKEFLTGIQGGTNTLNEIASDPALNDMLAKGWAKDDIRDYLANKWSTANGGIVDPLYRTRKQLDRIEKMVARDERVALKANLPFDEPASRAAAEALVTPRNRFNALTKQLASLKPEDRIAGMFPNHPLLDFNTARRGAETAIERGNTAFDILAQPNIMSPATGAARVENAMPVGEILTELGIKHDGGLQALADRMGLPAGTDLSQLSKSTVPKDIFADLLAINKRFSAPDAAGTAGKFIDNLTNIWKAGVTASPAFHARNFGSGQVQGLLNFGPKAWMENNAVRKMMQGQDVASFIEHPLVVEEAKRLGIANPTAHEATNIMRELVQRHSVVDRFSGEASARAGSLADDIGGKFTDYVHQFPGGLGGSEPGSVGKLAKTFAGKQDGGTLKPFSWKDKTSNIRGIGDTTETTFGPLAANEMVGAATESMNRIPSWISETRKGVDPAQAKRLVDAAQVAYSGRHYTPFEQQVLGRIFPFYKFSKGMSSHTLKALAEKPGGPLAQVIKATGGASDNTDVMLPDYLRQTLAIPIPEGTPLIGPEPGGDPRYLTGLGLMHEQDPFGFGGGGVQGAALEALSRVNPLIKGPIEYGMGRSSFQRGPGGARALEDQDPLLGRTISNISDLITGTRSREAVKPLGNNQWNATLEAALANSPGSRLLSNARTLTDPRKNWLASLLNTTTGVKLTDVPERTRDAVEEEALTSLMKQTGARSFENVYFSQAQKDAMTPEQRAKAVELQAFRSMLAKKQRARAKAAIAAQNQLIPQ